ncbi:MAG: hypothetical protein KKC46_02840 [Proteobacteria bacterium]|nr:hypothetical protein [Pseudomonadota bacterium]
MNTLFDIGNTIRMQLFPCLEQELDPLSDKELEFVQVIPLHDLPSHMKKFRWRGFGRKKKNRINMAKAFVDGNSHVKYHPAQRSLDPLQSLQHTVCHKKFTKQ